jgi:hypothetical protein
MTLQISNHTSATEGTKVRDFDADGKLIEGVLKYDPKAELKWSVLWNDGVETYVLIPEMLEAI